MNAEVDAPLAHVEDGRQVFAVPTDCSVAVALCLRQTLCGGETESDEPLGLPNNGANGGGQVAPMRAVPLVAHVLNRDPCTNGQGEQAQRPQERTDSPLL